jgi:hypothetical protein
MSGFLSLANKMGGNVVSVWGEDSCIQGFGGETWESEIT